MKYNSKNNKKRFFILGATTVVLSSVLTVGLSVGSVNTFPTGITPKEDYFTPERKKAVDQVISQIGITQDQFLEGSQNDDFKTIQSWKQFGLVHSHVTIDELIARLRALQNIGVWGESGNNINKVDLQTHIQALQNIKKRAEEATRNSSKINEVIAPQARNLRQLIINSLSYLPVSTSEQILRRDMIIDYRSINEMYKRSPAEFREYAFEYIKRWLNDTSNSGVVNSNKLSITLAQEDTGTANVLYAAGSKFTESNEEGWNSKFGTKIRQDFDTYKSTYTLTKGTNIFRDTSATATKKRNVVFVKDKLTRADFMLFHFIASGAFNKEQEAEKFSYTRTTKFNVGGTDGAQNIGKSRISVTKQTEDIGSSSNPENLRLSLNLESPTDAAHGNLQTALTNFQNEWFNERFFLSTIGRTSVKVDGDSTSSSTYNYQNSLKHTSRPDAVVYLARTYANLKTIIPTIFEPFEQEARKYFIELVYAGGDTGELINVNSVVTDNERRTLLNGTTKQGTLYANALNAYNTINKIPLIAHTDANTSSSLSFKWFVARRYKKNGAEFQMNYGGVPEQQRRDDWRFDTNASDTVPNRIKTSDEADEAFRTATDRMIYDYIEYITRIYEFNLSDPLHNDIFKNVYRLIRSVISFENNWVTARDDGSKAAEGYVALNGYNQDSSKAAHSERLLITTSMVTKFYRELISTLEVALSNAFNVYAQNPSESQLESISKIFYFFQIFFNPSQSDVDNLAVTVFPNDNQKTTLTKFISNNFPNFGKAAFNQNGTINTSKNVNTLIGLNVNYGSVNLFVHNQFLTTWRNDNGVAADTTLTKEQFAKVKESFDARLRRAVRELSLHTSLANSNTSELDRVRIDNRDYVIAAQYPFGKLLSAVEFTNLAVSPINRGVLDTISPSQIKTINLNTAAIYTELGLPATFNVDTELIGSALDAYTKKYFSVTQYSNYLNELRTKRNSNERLIPLSPDFTSPLYGNNYQTYSTDYNNYINEFYTSNAKTAIRPRALPPQPPQVYINLTTQNQSSYLDNYQKYIKASNDFYTFQKQRRNKALKEITNIELNTQEDLTYKIVLSNGQTISNNSELNEADGTSKITTNGANISHIELGPRKVRVQADSSYIVWKGTDKTAGIDRILPGPNGIIPNPSNLTQKITTRNLLISQLNRVAQLDYQRFYNEVNAWYTIVRSDLKASDLVRFNQQFQNYLPTNRTFEQVDGYTIASNGTTDITPDPQYPWDSIDKTSSLTLQNTSLFNSLNTFVSEVTASRNTTQSNVNKIRELVLDLISKSSKEETAYNTAKTTLNDFLEGRKILSSNNLVDASGTLVPLSGEFATAYTEAKEAISSADALKNYIKKVPGSTFNNYRNTLTSVSNNQYRDAIGTVSLIYEFTKFNGFTFDYNSTSAGAEKLDIANWKYQVLNLTDEQKANLTQYNQAVDNGTQANSAYRFFNKFFSEADPDSLSFIPDRDALINAVQDLYTYIGLTPGTGTGSYNPSTNTAQRDIDARNSALTEDIKHILPNQRANVASRYFEAANALERISIQTANLTALRATKAALNFAYTNARVTVGKYNRETLANEANFPPYFNYTVNNTDKTRSVNLTRTPGNKAVVIVNEAIKHTNALQSHPSISRNYEDYLTSLAASNELIYLEEMLVSTPQSTFTRTMFDQLDRKLVEISESLSSGFTLKPKYYDITDASVEKKFLPILNADLRNLILKKIYYLQYLGGYFYIKDNFIPEYDLDNASIDPINHLTEWNKFIQKIQQLGKSSVVYRSLPTTNQNNLNEVLKTAFPILNRPNSPTLSNGNPVVRDETFVVNHTPTLQGVNRLRDVLNTLNPIPNSIATLQSNYDTENAAKASLKTGSNYVTTAAEIFDKVITQTKNFLDIHKGENNSNSSFTNAAAVSPDNAKKITTTASLNQFVEKDIRDQITKLQNAKTLHEILLSIKQFRDQYTNVGIGGIANRKPQDLKSSVSPALYAAWENEEAKAKALFDNGTIPNYSTSLSNLNTLVGGSVNLQPGLDTSTNNLINITFAGVQLVNDFNAIRTNLENFQRELTVKTNALDNTVSTNNLIPLLNELNGQPTTAPSLNNVYNSTVVTNSLVNKFYAYSRSRFVGNNLPANTDSITSGLARFNRDFKAINAFDAAQRSQYNDFKYEEFLETQTAAGKGPASLKKDGSTTQVEVNKMIDHLNTELTTHVMAGIHWANTDFLLYKKFTELLLEQKDTTTALNDGTLLKERKYQFNSAYAAAKRYFETEAAKPDGRYVLMNSYDPNTPLNGKIPIIGLETKMPDYTYSANAVAWKNQAIRILNSPVNLINEYNNKGIVLETLINLNSALDTRNRESYIKAFNDFLTARAALNGTLTIVSVSDIPKDQPDKKTLDTEFNKITTDVGSNWETILNNRTNDLALRDLLRITKNLSNQNRYNRFVDRVEAADVLTRLTAAYAAKKEADKATRTEVVSRLPGIVQRITTILNNTGLSFAQKIEQIKTQSDSLIDAIGVKKRENTGVFNADKTAYTLATFEEDSKNLSGILQVFKTLDINLIKVAQTYAKTLQALDLLIEYMIAIDNAQTKPVQANSNIFSVFNSALEEAFATTATTQLQMARIDTPTLQTSTESSTDSRVTLSSSTTDITTLTSFFAALDSNKASIKVSSASVKAVIDGLADTKYALKKWLSDLNVTYTDTALFSTRQTLIDKAKEKIDTMNASNTAANLIKTEPFNLYRDQLNGYFKALLSLEKIRNNFYAVLNDSESPTVNNPPNNSVDKASVDLLYSEYISFKTKLRATTNESIKNLYHIVKNNFLNPEKRAKINATFTLWSNHLRTIIDNLTSGNNPNNVETNSVDLFRKLKEKADTGFTLFSNYFTYLEVNFIADPAVSDAKVETPNNFRFELESGIRNYKKANVVIPEDVSINLSSTIRSLIAFNGLFTIGSLPDESKLGALNRLLKVPLRENIEKTRTLANNIKTSLLQTFKDAITKIPSELSKTEDLSSWTVMRFLNDLKDETEINLLKFDLIDKLQNYLFLTNDETKTALTTSLNSFTSEENKNKLKAILDNGETAIPYRENYLEALKQLALKTSKIADQFNIIDKLVVGQNDPNDSTTTVTAANIDSLRTKYLDLAALMVDDTLDPTEITNLNSEITNETVRNFVLSEIGLSHIKALIKVKIERKRFEVLISILKDLPLEQYVETNKTLIAVRANISNANQPEYLKIIARLAIAQKDYEKAYTNFVTNDAVVSNDSLLSFEGTFLLAKRNFDALKTQQATWVPSEVLLFTQSESLATTIRLESELVNLLQKYVEVPSDENKTAVVEKLASVPQASQTRKVIDKYIKPVLELANKVNAYWDKETDKTANASLENTVASADAILTEINTKVNVAESVKVSPYYKTLQQRMQVLKATVNTEKDIKNFLEFDSLAVRGEPSFDDTTNALIDKDTLSGIIQETNLKTVDTEISLLPAGVKRQSLALRELLDIVDVIHKSVDLISILTPNNYLGNTDREGLGLVEVAYTSRIKPIFDRFVVNSDNWTNLIVNNSYSRVLQFATRTLEQVKALNQLSKVLYLFSQATQNVTGVNEILIGKDKTFYDEFVKEYAILKANYEKYKTNTSDSDVAVPNLYNEKTDFWRAFDRSFILIDALHKPDKTGAIDKVNDFLVNHISDATKSREASSLVDALFDLKVDGKITNNSFRGVASLLLNQLTQTNLITNITISINNYYEGKMEEGYWKYLGKYEGATQTRIETNIKNITDAFGTSDNSVVGSRWAYEVTVALENNPRKVERLRNAVRSIQKYIDQILKLQLVVDDYVKFPTEVNRNSAMNAELWANFETYFSEVKALADSVPDDTISPSLVDLSKRLVNLKDVQKNKMRIVQGLLVAVTSPDLTKIDLEAIVNPYENGKAILGETFNLLSAVGLEKTANAEVALSLIPGSLLFGATRFSNSSDVLVYQLLNLDTTDPEANITRFKFPDGTSIGEIVWDLYLKGKNATYVPTLFAVQAAFKSYINAELYKPENVEEFTKFTSSLLPLLDKIKNLNFNKTEIDTENTSLYQGIAITIPTSTTPRSDINIEKVLHNMVFFLSKLVQYDTLADVFVKNPTEKTYEELQRARSELTEAKKDVVENRSEAQITAEDELEKVLDTLNVSRVAFDNYKQNPSSSNFVTLTQATAQLNAAIDSLKPLRSDLVPSKMVIASKLDSKFASLQIQINLIRVINNYALTPTEVNKTAVDTELEKIRALPESLQDQTQEKILLEQVLKVKDVVDMVLPLKAAYEAPINFDGVETNRLLVIALTAFEGLKSQNENDPLIQALASRIQITLKNIEANRNIDNSLSKFVSLLSQDAKTELEQTVAASKLLIKGVATDEAKTDQLSPTLTERSETLASESIPSYITSEYIDVANQAFETFKLFEQYKLTPTDELKNQIERGIAKVHLLNEAAKRLSLEIDKIASPTVLVDSTLGKMAAEYDVKFPDEVGFGSKTLSRITTFVNELISKKAALTSAFNETRNALLLLQSDSNANQEALINATNNFNEAALQLKKFNSLIVPFTTGQKVINPLITLRMNAIELQIAVVSALKTYVDAKKVYSDEIYPVGKKLVQTRDEKNRITRLITDATQRKTRLDQEISDLSAIVNPVDTVIAQLADLKAQLATLEEQLASHTQSLQTQTALETQLQTQLQNALDRTFDATLKTAVDTAVAKLFAQSTKIDAESLKSGNKERSNETKLGLQAKNTVIMLEDLKDVLSKYFLNPTSFVSDKYVQFKEHSKNFEEMKKDVVVILPQAIFDAISSSLLTVVNDLTALDANTDLILSNVDQLEENKKKATEANNQNNTIEDISVAVNYLSSFKNLLEIVKTSLSDTALQNSRTLFTEISTHLNNLLNTSFLENQNISNLLSLLKDSAFVKTLSILRSQLELINVFNNYAILPNAENHTALSNSIVVLKELQKLTDEEKKIRLLASLDTLSTELLGITELITNETKNALGDEVEKLLTKSTADPTSVTVLEISNLRNSLITGNKKPPVDSIKAKLIIVLNKIEADRRVAILIKDLGASVDSTSDLSITHDTNPVGFVEKDKERIIEDRDKTVATIDTAIAKVNADAIKDIEAAKKTITDIEAKDPSTVTPEETIKLSNAQAIIEAISEPKATYDEKAAATTETTTQLDAVKKELTPLEEKRTSALTDEEKKSLAEAEAKITQLQRELRKKQAEKIANDREIKLLEDKEVLVLTENQRRRLRTLKNLKRRTLAPSLVKATNDLNTATEATASLIDDKAASVLNEEEKNAFKAQKDLVKTLGDSLTKAESDLSENKKKIEDILNENAQDALTDRELKEYVRAKSEVASTKHSKHLTNQLLDQNSKELAGLKAKADDTLTHEEREKIAELEAREKALKESINNIDKLLEINKNIVTKIEEKIAEALPEDKKTEYDNLTNQTPSLTESITTAKKAITDNETAMEINKTKIISTFTDDERKAYIDAKKIEDAARIKENNAKNLLKTNEIEIKAFEDKIAVSLTSAEREKLKKLKEKTPALTEAITNAAKEVASNKAVIDEKNAKKDAALSSEEKAKYVELTSSVSTLEDQLAANKNEETVALNGLTSAHLDAKKDLAEKEVKDHKEKIVAKEAEIETSLTNISDEGIAKTTKLKEELTKLNEDLKPLENEVVKLAGAKEDIASLDVHRTKVIEEANKKLAKNDEEIKKITESTVNGIITRPLTDVIASVASESAKEATTAATAADIPQNEAEKYEIIVKAIGSKKELEDSRDAFNKNPSAENSERLIKAIEKFNETNTNLSGVDIDKLPDSTRDTISTLIADNAATKFETDIIEAANTALENPNTANKEALQTAIATAKTELSSATVALEEAKALEDTDVSKVQKVADATRRVEGAKKAIETADKLDRYKSTLDSLQSAKENIDKEPKTDLSTIKSIENDLALFSEDDSDPILKLVRDTTKKQIEELKTAVAAENSKVALEKAAKTFAETSTTEAFKDFVNKLTDAQNKKTSNSQQYTDIKMAIDSFGAAINSYESSNVNIESTLKAATREINAAKNSARAVLDNPNASKDAKALATAIISRLDVLSNNVTTATNNKDNAKKSLSLAITTYTVNNSEQTLTALKTAIEQANNARVSTADINLLLEVETNISDIAKLVESLKKDFTVVSNRTKLAKDLTEAATKLNAAKALSEKHPEAKRLGEKLSLQLENLDIEGKILAGNANSRFLGRRLDNKAQKVDVLENKTVAADLTSIKDEISKLPIKERPQRVIKAALSEKVEKIENEIAARDLLETLSVTPTDEQITNLQEFINNSFGNYSTLVDVISLGSNVRKQLEELRNLNHGDITINTRIETLREQSTLAVNNAIALSTSPNQTVKKYATKVLAKDKETDLFVNAETNLYEGITQISKEKIDKAKEFYKQLFEIMDMPNKQQYDKLFELLSNWEQLIKDAKDGNIQAIINIKNIQREISNLTDVSRVSISSINTEIDKYSLGGSTKWKIAIAATVSSAIGALAATAAFIFRRRRRRRK